MKTELITGRGVAVAVSLLLAGCVGMEMGDDPGGAQGTPGVLSKEQKWDLRSAAKSGEHELSAAAARLAWQEPDDRKAIVDYALELLPESEEAVRVAVYGRTPGPR